MQRGNERCVEILLNYGADPNQSTRGAKPLVLAAMHGHTKIVEMLIGRSINIEAFSDALREAISKRHLDIINILLLNKLEEIKTPTPEEMDLLSESCKCLIKFHHDGLEEVIECLSKKGITPPKLLITTVRSHEYEMVKTLLDKLNFEKDEIDRAMYEVLLWQYRYTGNFEGLLTQAAMVEILLEGGANPNMRMFFNNTITVLEYAVMECQHVGIVTMLLNKGADPNIQDPQGKTLLMRLLDGSMDIDSDYRLNIAKKLLEKGADLKLKDDQDYTAFEHAIISYEDNVEDIAVLLAGAGADIDLSKSDVLSKMRYFYPKYFGLTYIEKASGVLNILDKLIELMPSNSRINSLLDELGSTIREAEPILDFFLQEGISKDTDVLFYLKNRSKLLDFEALCEVLCLDLENRTAVKELLDNKFQGFSIKIQDNLSLTKELLEAIHKYTLKSNYKFFEKAIDNKDIIGEITSFLNDKDQGRLLLSSKNIMSSAFMVSDDSHVENDQASKRQKIDGSVVSTLGTLDSKMDMVHDDI